VELHKRNYCFKTRGLPIGAENTVFGYAIDSISTGSVTRAAREPAGSGIAECPEAPIPSTGEFILPSVFLD
jgi:hypothetical protein